MKGGPNIARSIFRDVAVPAQLGGELLELCIGLGQLVVEGHEQVEQVLGLNAAGAKELQGTTFDAHGELSFNCCSLTYDFVPCQESVDAFT